MMFILSFLLPAFLPFTLAAVLGRAQPGYPYETPTTSVSSTTSPTAASTPTPFTVIAAHSTSPIHLQSVNAAHGGFYIGEDSDGYCPLADPSECVNGSYTAFLVGDGGCSLDVQVPGGQSVFVLPSGELGFTVPHSGEYPPGAVITGFVETPGSSFGVFGFTGLGSTGFVACPTVSNTGPYQVYAQVAGFVAPNSNDCIGFDALSVPASGPGAFEYF